MAIDSRILFQQLVRSLNIDADASEKGAIVFLMLEKQYTLSKTDMMKGKEVEGSVSSFNEAISRINKNEPVQYVLGEAYFNGRKFFVNNSVLIPRPETELIIEHTVDKVKNKKNPAIVDVGTGSGCIAVSLALELPSSKVFATDISKSALEVAERNARKLRATVNFKLHDILATRLDLGALDIIVSNPPYISESERSAIAKNITDHEPGLALFVPDPDPLKFYNALAEEANKSLKSGGYLITEINERFGKETAALFTKNDLADVEIIKDLDGKDRLVIAKKL